MKVIPAISIGTINIGDLIIYPSASLSGNDIGLVYDLVKDHVYKVYWVNKNGSFEHTEETVEGVNEWRNGAVFCKV